MNPRALAQTLWRNRPSLKPQLWEDFGLALRRRAEFEVRRRIDPKWLDDTVTIRLSDVGFPQGGPSIRLKVRPRDVTNQTMFLYGVFEISETRLIQTLLRPGMVFVDVGANVGYYT